MYQRSNRFYSGRPTFAGSGSGVSSFSSSSSKGKYYRKRGVLVLVVSGITIGFILLLLVLFGKIQEEPVGIANSDPNDIREEIEEDALPPIVDIASTDLSKSVLEEGQSSGELDKDEDVGFDPYTVKLPNVVAYDVDGEDEDVRRKRNAIKQAFSHAYGGYEQRCLGQGEEVKPISGSCNDWLIRGMGLSLIDSLDTMLIMNHTDYYKRAREFLMSNLDWNRPIIVSVFETNIRCVGGLLAAYDMTKDTFLLKSAVELAMRLLPAFDTPTGLPRTSVNLTSGAATNPQWTNRASLLAEMGTMQVEFSFLSYMSKNNIFSEKVLSVYHFLVDKVMPEDKLFPVFIHPEDGKPRGQDLISVGALGDSFYEYLLKYWLLTEKASEFGKLYYDVVESIIQKLAFKIIVDGEEMWYIAERQNYRVVHKFDHLACFFGGLLALGAKHAPSADIGKRHMEIGEGIAKFCRKMYTMNPTKLSCEHVTVSNQVIHNPSSAGKAWIMRPEAVETWFILYRLTNDTKYQNWGWEYFEAIEKYSKKEFGYTGLRDATNPDHLEPDDVQQSYFLAETLKYLYLLFSPHDVIPLNKFVFNTEAHPLSIISYKF